MLDPLEFRTRKEARPVGLSTSLPGQLGPGAPVQPRSVLTEQLSTPPCGEPAHSMRLLICTG